jgi:hypothetical protein
MCINFYFPEQREHEHEIWTQVMFPASRGIKKVTYRSDFQHLILGSSIVSVLGLSTIEKLKELAS